MDISDKELIRQITGGERLGWENFIRIYSRFIVSVIRKTSFSFQEEDIQDIYQQILLSLIEKDYRKLKQFKGTDGCLLKTWLGVVTKRGAINYIKKIIEKKKKREIPLTVIEEKRGVSGDKGEYDIEAGDRKNIVLLRGIVDEHLGPREQLFMRLFFVKELGATEIGRTLDMKEGAVYVLKNRVLNKIRKIYRKKYSQPVSI